MSSLESNQNVEESGTNELKKDFFDPLEIIENLKEVDKEINNLAKQITNKKNEKDKLYKCLLKLSSKMIKDLEKIKSKKKNHSKGGGLSVPYEISEEFKKFLNLENKKYSRGEITTILTKSIKDKGLKDPENSKILKFTKKSEIFKILQVKETDGDLRNLNDDEMSDVKVFGGINKYIQHHFIK